MANYPTYNGREVLIGNSVVESFTKYMENITLPFTYDMAVSIFK